MAQIFKNITEVVGKTPLVQLNNLTKDMEATVLAKLEMFNPGSSIKDRIAVAMIEDAEKTGKLKQDTTIIEPTSGNTGIGLAWASAAKGYRLILTMPESMSLERRNILKALGVELVLTEAHKGMRGAIQKAEELHQEMKNSFMPQQFKNPSNPEIHRKTTAEEIWKDTNGQIDIFVVGIGTGGTITGVSEVLKKYKPELKTIAIEPTGSPVLSGGSPGPHKIQGIGSGFVPDILNKDIIDEIIQVSDENAYDTARKLAKYEGLIVGISCGAAAFATLEVAKRPENKNKTIVTVFPDTGERYLSAGIYSSK